MESKKQTFVEKIASKLLPISEKLNNNKYLGSMRDGFYYAMPLIIVGSLFLIFPNFPIPAVVKWVNLVQLGLITVIVHIILALG